jgi:hypothetical protein
LKIGKLIGWIRRVGRIGVWRKGWRGRLVEDADDVGCSFAVDRSIFIFTGDINVEF